MNEKPRDNDFTSTANALGGLLHEEVHSLVMLFMDPKYLKKECKTLRNFNTRLNQASMHYLPDDASPLIHEIQKIMIQKDYKIDDLNKHQETWYEIALMIKEHHPRALRDSGMAITWLSSIIGNRAPEPRLGWDDLIGTHDKLGNPKSIPRKPDFTIVSDSED